MPIAEERSVETSPWGTAGGTWCSRPLGIDSRIKTTVDVLSRRKQHINTWCLDRECETHNRNKEHRGHTYQINERPSGVPVLQRERHSMMKSTFPPEMADTAASVSASVSVFALTFMMASVWMYSMSELWRPSSRLPRCVVLMIPVVTVFCSENGLPTATTNSPGRRSEERPRDRTGKASYMEGKMPLVCMKIY